MTKEQTQAVRDRACYTCQHEWTQRVEYTKHTTNLSGEATVYCPKCNSRTIMSYPTYFVKSEARGDKQQVTTPT